VAEDWGSVAGWEAEDWVEADWEEEDLEAAGSDWEAAG